MGNVDIGIEYYQFFKINLVNTIFLFASQVSINLDANGNSQKCRVEPLNNWSKPSDFPVINPAFSGKKNTLIYAATSSGSRQALPHFPFDTVVKLNVSTNTNRTWSTGARRFIGEPIFVPRGVEEDDGYILVVEVKQNPKKEFGIFYKI